MIFFSAGLVAALIGLHLQAQVPTQSLAWMVFPALLLALWPRPWSKTLAGLLVGLWLGADSAQDWLKHALPLQGPVVEARVVVEVEGLPVHSEQRTRFRARILEVLETSGPLPARSIQITAFPALPELLPGERAQLSLRIRPPRGLHNPGLFDYGGYLYQQGLHGVATVRGSVERMPPADRMSFAAWRDRARDRIRSALRAAYPEAQHPGVLDALVIGERSGMAREEWDRFLQTGTNHLVAISGLHIGLIAGFFLAIGRWSWRLLPFLQAFSTQRSYSLALALGAAAVYAAMAGFSVPTQRALLMLLLFSLAAWLGRNPWSWRVYAAAMTLVLIFDPTAILAPGFWFSFLAVASILLFMQGRVGAPDWMGWIRLQVILSLLLLPLGIAWFQLGSWSAPLANLIAVPLVTFWVLPLLLFGSGVALLSPTLATVPILLADIGVRVLLSALEIILRLPIAVTESAVPWPLIMISTLGLLLLYLPLGARASHWALLPLIPLLLPIQTGSAPGEFSLQLLDTHSGQAVIVRTRHHQLLFDTGPPAGGSSGIPPISLQALNQLGLRELDALIVSHTHRDHGGALDAILERFPVRQLWVRDAHDHPEAETCHAGLEWTRDGVRFQFLHPPENWDTGASASCVLLISSPAGTALLTGGITGLGLAVLLRELHLEHPIDVLILPPRTEDALQHPLVQRLQPHTVWISRNPTQRPLPTTTPPTAHTPNLQQTLHHGQLRARFKHTGPEYHTGSRNQPPRFWLHHPQ